MSQRFLVAALAAFFSFTILPAAAHASFLFEPLGGYVNGKLSRTSVAGESDSSSISGFQYGGRIGVMLQHFIIIAGEYQALNGKSKPDSGDALDLNHHTTFATIGFQAPRGFRLLGSYGFDSQADISTAPDKTTLKGTAMKITAGWHLPMPVAINVEYTIYKMTDFKVGNYSGKISDGYSKFDYSTVMANISFPFEFGIGGGGGGSRSSRGR